jgi:hypothetical protein
VVLVGIIEGGGSWRVKVQIAEIPTPAQGGSSLGLKAIAKMSDRLSFSIFTIEVDGKPTLAFGAKRYSEAEAICGDHGLRAKLSLLKSGDVPIYGDNALLDVRLARPDEVAIYRQAAGASQFTNDLILVYLVEADGQDDQQT